MQVLALYLKYERRLRLVPIQILYLSSDLPYHAQGRAIKPTGQIAMLNLKKLSQGLAPTFAAHQPVFAGKTCSAALLVSLQLVLELLSLGLVLALIKALTIFSKRETSRCCLGSLKIICYSATSTLVNATLKAVRMAAYE